MKKTFILFVMVAIAALTSLPLTAEVAPDGKCASGKCAIGKCGQGKCASGKCGGEK